MKDFTLLVFCLLCLSPLSAQYSWDGGGDGTSWNDAANWQRDEVPAADSLVVFAREATVTGTAENIPAGIRIVAKSSVVLDLDLTAGNGMADEHVIIIGDSSRLTLGGGTAARTIVINAKNDKHGVAIFGGANNAGLTVTENTTVEARAGLSGINLANGTSTVTNNGMLILTNGVRDGVRAIGTFINSGTVAGADLERDLFNVRDGGTLTNTETGTITADRPGDDAIELLSGAIFVNNGTLQLTAKDDAGFGNSAIAVGDRTTAATFINNGTDVVLSGGGGTGDLVGRALIVDTLGQFTNNGTLTLSGGNEGARLFVRGTATNGLNALVDLTDGRFTVPVGGSLTNNGLFKSTRDGAAGFVIGTATNNAFYDYAMSNAFAVGAEGIIIDKGFSLNNNDTRVNARQQCTVDLANAPYEWFLDAEAYAVASDTGALTFTENSLLADSVVLTTTLPGVEVKVVNICAAAVRSTNVFQPRLDTEFLPAYPNPAPRGSDLVLDLGGWSAQPLDFFVDDAFGRRIAAFTVTGGGLQTINTARWPAGTYTVRARRGETLLVARVMIME